MTMKGALMRAGIQSVESIAFFLALAFVPAVSTAQTASAVEIYFIDVEGGQSTLIKLPGGQTLLVDAGFPGTGTFSSSAGEPRKARDPQRIVDVARRAGVSRIDYLVVTHYHADHVGGVPELAQLLPIDTFIDHGALGNDADKVAGTSAMFEAYLSVRAKRRHLEPRPGDLLPIGGVDFAIVSSGESTLAHPLAGAAPGQNPACAPPGVPAQETAENPRSLGFLLQFGKFRFLDLGDLTGAPLFSLACPSDRVGPVDVYLVAHHGGADASEPALFNALKPRVAILNNGAAKGGAPATLKTLHALSETETWQIHRSEIEGAENSPADHIANVSVATAHWLRVRGHEDGSFTVTNGRTGATESFSAR